MDNRATDSAGNLCGEGVHAGKPYSFYFDPTLCAKLNSTSQPCPSVQVHTYNLEKVQAHNLGKKSIQFQEKVVFAPPGVCERMPGQLSHFYPGIKICHIMQLTPRMAEKLWMGALSNVKCAG